MCFLLTDYLSCTYLQDRMERRSVPISCLDQLCNTRVLRATNQDCGSSSVLQRDSRQDSFHPAVRDLNLVREVNPMTTLDTSFH